MNNIICKNPVNLYIKFNGRVSSDWDIDGSYGIYPDNGNLDLYLAYQYKDSISNDGTVIKTPSPGNTSGQFRRFGSFRGKYNGKSLTAITTAYAGTSITNLNNGQANRSDPNGVFVIPVNGFGTAPNQSLDDYYCYSLLFHWWDNRSMNSRDDVDSYFKIGEVLYNAGGSSPFIRPKIGEFTP